MNSKEKIYVFGGSDHARLTMDIIHHEGKYEILGVLDSSLPLNKKIGDLKVLGRIEDLPTLCRQSGVKKGIIAIGDNYSRYSVSKKIKDLIPEFEFVSTIHPSVIIGSRVNLGIGCIISAGVVINNDCTLDDHCYLALNSGISHDSYLGKYASLGPGAIAGGNVTIGKCTAVGLGAHVLNGRKIGSFSVVGSASLVYHDVDDRVVVMGIPAKEVRKRSKDERYL